MAGTQPQPRQIIQDPVGDQAGHGKGDVEREAHRAAGRTRHRRGQRWLEGVQEHGQPEPIGLVEHLGEATVGDTHAVDVGAEFHPG